MSLPTMAWKILTGPQWAELLERGSFAGSPADLIDGYIHMSTRDQVKGTLNKWFAGQNDLHLLAVNLLPLGDAVKWEAARGGDLFPHLYADLPLTAVEIHGPIKWIAPGIFVWPDRP